ncbi:MAG: cation:proton antiporter [Acholeplasmatales bacterium]|nr:cation:proton antiporter [Acholeplasmatales bacterium]
MFLIDGIQIFEVLLPLALILVVSKLLSIGARKIGLPQVIGMLLTGVILGCIVFIPNQPIINESSQFGIEVFAEIGVILIMFSAGMETNLKQIKQTGVASIVITILGVIVPMALGFVASLILGGDLSDTKTIFRNVFYGVILTATSVSVTITTLKELGKLNSKIGTAIVSAAILDDIIGVIVLSIIISLDGAMTVGDPNANIALDISMVFIKTILFFVLAIGLGFFFRWIFKKLANKYDHHRRIPIFAMALAFFYAYAAEKWFGIADITGAFFAGLILSDFKETNYIERRADITSYLLFTPVFFAKVGLTSMSSFTEANSGFNLQFAIFGLVFILAGMAGKVLGCGVGAKICKYSFKDSLRCGIGMMCRAEVCLICAQKGIDAGIIDASIQPFILVLILVTSFITPVILKATYKKELQDEMSIIETPMVENQTSSEPIEVKNESYSGLSMDQGQK